MVAAANMASSWSIALVCVPTIGVLGTQLPMLVSWAPSVGPTMYPGLLPPCDGTVKRADRAPRVSQRLSWVGELIDRVRRLPLIERHAAGGHGRHDDRGVVRR